MEHSHRFVVTIDGAAGTGKSSVAQELANRLGTDCLDTGAMYRAVAVLAIENEINPTEGFKLSSAIQKVGITFDWDNTPPTVLLGDEDISNRIRELDISGVVSIVAKQPEVREVLVKQQRKIGESHPFLVTEGRDQGSVVFPDAAIKFYLVAAVDERTKRRVKQLRASGTDVKDEEVQQDIESRDQLDSTRTDGPLTCPKGAIIIDTSSMTVTEVVDVMESKVTDVLSF
jgi:cytidylate kinase